VTLLPGIAGASEMRKRRATKWLASMLLLGLAGGMFALLQPPERLLLSRSTLVAYSDRFDQYNWQSDHALFLFRQRRERPYYWLCETVDLRTGQFLFYLPFAQQFKDQSTAVANFETSFATSPDGKWLLWSRLEGEGLTLQAIGCLANIETGHTEHFPLGSSTFIDSIRLNRLYWLADSKRFAEPDLGRSLTTVRDVNAPQQTTKIPLPSGLNLTTDSGIHVYSENRLLATTNRYYNPYTYLSNLPDLIQTGLNSDAPTAQRRPLALPNGTCLVADVAFSPQGDRYTIATLVDPHPVWLDILQRWNIPVHIPSHPQVGLWILTLDGKQQEIGYLTPEPTNTTSHWPYEMPRDLRWSPDGKQLGFVYKGDLYRVPTN